MGGKKKGKLGKEEGMLGKEEGVLGPKKLNGGGKLNPGETGGTFISGISKAKSLRDTTMEDEEHEEHGEVKLERSNVATQAMRIGRRAIL